MRLVRFGNPGTERPGRTDEQRRIRDLSSIIPDVAGSSLAPGSLLQVRRIPCEDLPLAPEGARIGPCVGSIGKFICIGLNYSDHAAESGMAVPLESVVFMKATSAICGSNDDVELPKNSQKSDWEVELGVVIGTKAKYVSEEDVFSYVAGYCVVTDLSERAFQLEGTGQWVKGKSADTFGPIGPWLVTADEVPDPQNLHLCLEVDGHRYQDGSTRTMIFGVAYLSQVSESLHDAPSRRHHFDGYAPGCRFRTNARRLPAYRQRHPASDRRTGGAASEHDRLAGNLKAQAR